MLIVLALLASPPTCAAPRAGTHCVESQPLEVGSDAWQRHVDGERFYIDDAPLTVQQLGECIDAKACDPVKPKGEPTAPALVGYGQAERACAYFGMRLPSEWEWEAAQAVQPSGAASEWTQSWWTEPADCKQPLLTIESATHGSWPAALCGSNDRLDPCDSAFYCGELTRKIFKNAAKPTARERTAYESTKVAAARCASHLSYRTRFPSTFTARSRTRPSQLSQPTPEQLAIFNAIEEDVLDTPLCDKAGRSFENCRDPRSYLTTNEPRQDVVLGTIKDLGGGYTGVGSDQNYTQVAAAKSEWAWLFDYDPNVVLWHRVMRSLILAAPTRQEFVAYFDPAKSADAVAVIEKEYAADKDVKSLASLFKLSSGRVRAHYVGQASLDFSWLGNDASYAYVRMMFAAGRMRAFKGNMLDVHTMQSIAASAKKLGVPMRIYYPSNAHEFWPFSDQYRKNVTALPFDEQSVVVQTISSVKTGFGQTGYWHYNVEYAFEHARTMKKKAITRERQILTWRVKTDNTELTLSGMPSE